MRKWGFNFEKHDTFQNNFKYLENKSLNEKLENMASK